MHQAPAGPAHQDRAYEFVECPMKAATLGQSDIDPTNMVQTGEHGGIFPCITLRRLPVSFLFLRQLNSCPVKPAVAPAG